MAGSNKIIRGYSQPGIFLHSISLSSYVVAFRISQACLLTRVDGCNLFLVEPSSGDITIRCIKPDHGSNSEALGIMSFIADTCLSISVIGFMIIILQMFKWMTFVGIKKRIKQKVNCTSVILIILCLTKEKAVISCKIQVYLKHHDSKAKT